MTAAQTAAAAAWRELGARPAEVGELLAYAASPFDTTALAQVANGPPVDEPFVAAWSGYVDEAAGGSAAAVLRRHIIQLQFPIAPGVSQTAGYQAATRRGELPRHECGADFERPESVRVRLHATASGRVPVIVAATRADFETLVRAFVHRNEPAPILPAMGACIVSGYVNWSRVADARNAWNAANPGDTDGAGWAGAFQALAADKPRYQDRLIILSTGPYSGTPAHVVGMHPDEWLARSLELRTEHECAHYYTRRVLGSMRNSLIDELIADFVGIVSATGRYDADWFCHFMGVERPGILRDSGRLWRYRGEPALSDGAFGVLQHAVRACARCLADVEAGVREKGGLRDTPLRARARWIHAIALCGVETLAGRRGVGALEAALARTGGHDDARGHAHEAADRRSRVAHGGVYRVPTERPKRVWPA